MRNIAATLLALTLVGCDQLGSFTATTQAVSVLTRTPDISSAVGWDSDLAAVLPSDPAAQSAAAVLVGVGERDSVTSTTPPTPIAGATVSVAWGSGNVSLCEVTNPPEAEGTYQTNSLPNADLCGNANFAYVVDDTYTTTIETASDVYTLSVKAPAAVNASLVDFTPQLGTATGMPSQLTLQHHPINQDLTVAWTRDADASTKNVFVTLVRANYNGAANDPQALLDPNNWLFDQNNPVFDNAPREPAGMIDLITKVPPTSVDIPGAKLNEKGLYLLVLTAAALSTDTSNNLAIGSGALAGFGTAFLIFID